MFLKRFRSDDIFFTSDLHLYHINICKGVSKWDNTEGCRDFKDIDSMNAAIINSINETVPATGTLFCLGDMIFGKASNLSPIREQINCQNIIYIFGNHCLKIRNDKDLLKKNFSWWGDYLEVFINGKLVVLSHYAHQIWNGSHKGSYHIYGHSHGSSSPIGRSLDIGWDCFQKPLSFKEVSSILEKKEIGQRDHHDKTTNTF